MKYFCSALYQGGDAVCFASSRKAIVQIGVGESTSKIGVLDVLRELSEGEEEERRGTKLQQSAEGNKTTKRRTKLLTRSLYINSLAIFLIFQK